MARWQFNVLFWTGFGLVVVFPIAMLIWAVWIAYNP